MKSITIHNLDDNLDLLIRKQAREKGLSLNKTIKYLLQKALGIKRDKKTDNIDDYRDLFGIWDEKEYQQFEEKISEFEEVDQSDWQ
jgi:hypothetical protein